MRFDLADWFDRSRQVRRVLRVLGGLGVGLRRVVRHGDDRPAGRLRFRGDRQVHVFLQWLESTFRRRAHRGPQRVHDSAALVFAVDFGLRRDGEPGLGELMLGPHDFGLAANLGPLDGDCGLGRQLGALALRARRSMPIVGRLAAPQPQDERQQIEQREKRDR